MNELLKKSIFFVILLMVSMNLQSQVEPPQVTRSNNKVVIGGKVYYIHVVKQGETLFSISRAYEITQKEILEENPEVEAGLQVGQALKIPEKPVLVELVKLPESDEFIYHIIKEGQTIYSLSKAYNISVEEIVKYNPELEYSNLQVNQVIKIPRKKIASALRKVEDANDEDYIYHRVARGETLYSLSRQYDVTIDQILEANQSVRQTGLKTNDEIRIPVKKKEVIKTLSVIGDSIVVDTYEAIPDTLSPRIDTAFCDTLVGINYKHPIKVALLIPLYLDKGQRTNREVDTELGDYGPERIPGLESLPRDFDRRSGNFLEFYEGVLMALDELKADGLSVTLHVYDTGHGSDKMFRIINDMRIKDIDLIIGPFYSSQLQIISRFSSENMIPLVSPVSARSELLTGNPLQFHVTPSSNTLMEQAARFTSNYSNSNIVMIHPGDSITQQNVDLFRRKLLFSASEKGTPAIIFKEVVYNDTIKMPLDLALSRNEQNFVIIPSNREVYVSEVLRNLHILLRSYSITILGGPAWPQFGSIDTEIFHDFELIYYTPFYLDQENAQVRKFYKNFMDIYQYYPYQVSSYGYNYAILGYDIFSYFLKVYGRYGDRFSECATSFKPNLLLTKYQFSRASLNNGFENNSVNFVRYEKELYIKHMELIPDVNEREGLVSFE